MYVKYEDLVIFCIGTTLTHLAWYIGDRQLETLNAASQHITTCLVLLVCCYVWSERKEQ